MKQIAKALLPKLFVRKLGPLFHTIRAWLLRWCARDFSQAGETLTVRQILRKFPERTFVEVGANDGVTVSTTFGLIVDGWSGVSIEANPHVFEKLKRNLAAYPKVTTVCCAVSPVAGRVKLFLGKNDPMGLLSTISVEDSEWFRANRGTNFVEVDGLPLLEILRRKCVPKRFGLLLIDAEGMDLEILQTFDLRLYRPRLIITEDYPPKNEAKFALLAQANYRFLKRIGCNTFWLDAEGS